MEARERHVGTRRTARYHVLGEVGPGTSEVWFVLHGYGQLASYFIRHFEAVAREDRVVVAPEALSRFYLGDRDDAMADTARVGASWMTREDRLVEIDDYVAYLDALHDDVMAGRAPEDARVTVLGFSQGVAAACRWACRGRVRPHRLVVWAGLLPNELRTARDAVPLAATRLVRVLGSRDPYATGERLAAEERRMEMLGLSGELLRFDGGHELDYGVLAVLASTPI